MIAVIDYGVGNLFSVAKAVEAVGASVEITGDAQKIRAADKLILPGVGAFGDCMKNLRERGLDEVIKEQIGLGKPLLGICVGLQILFDGSEESPDARGLGIFRGTVKKIRADGLKIPHMGWNKTIRNEELGIRNEKTGLLIPHSAFLIPNCISNCFFYFVHSYHAVPDDRSIIAATTEYGECLTAAIAHDNILAVQFHPEKSGDVGLKLLQNFIGQE